MSAFQKGEGKTKAIVEVMTDVTFPPASQIQFPLLELREDIKREIVKAHLKDVGSASSAALEDQQGLDTSHLDGAGKS